MDEKILETVADIAYVFGSQGYFTGDSRADIQEVIHLAKKFEKQNHNWEREDYIDQINNYANKNLNELLSLYQSEG